MPKIRTNLNLRIAAPLAFASMLFFPSAIWMFFYIQYLSFAEIAAIMAMGAIFSIILEVPTGVFADVVGRKWAVFASYVLFAIAMVGVATSTSYLWFLIWTLVNGMVNALYSGSMEALVYDTLKEIEKEDEFDHWVSRMEAATWVGLFISTVIGGYLYT
ncbi:MFS transporter, partial [Candidatus Microgenomates bacterium CPR3]|nr:MFS transporter [Candidatus Microgenomates bacterium CPR3]